MRSRPKQLMAVFLCEQKTILLFGRKMDSVGVRARRRAFGNCSNGILPSSPSSRAKGEFHHANQTVIRSPVRQLPPVWRIDGQFESGEPCVGHEGPSTRPGDQAGRSGSQPDIHRIEAARSKSTGHAARRSPDRTGKDRSDPGLDFPGRTLAEWRCGSRPTQGGRVGAVGKEDLTAPIPEGHRAWWAYWQSISRNGAGAG